MIKLRILNIALFGIQAPYIYLASFALAIGVKDDELSILIGLSFLSAFLGQLVWGKVSDAIKSTKKVVVGCIIISIFIILSIYFNNGVMMFYVSYILLAFFVSPLLAVLDSWTLDLLNYDGRDYGSVKGSASTAFAISMLVIGYLIEKTGFLIILISFMVFCFTCIIMSLLLKDKSFDCTVTRKRNYSVWNQPGFTVLLVIAFLLGLAIAPPNNLKILIINHAGGNVAHMGVDNFLGYIAQALMYTLAGRFNQDNLNKQLGIASICSGVGILLAVLARNVFMIYISTLLVYGAFSVENIVLRLIAKKMFASEYLTSALSLIDAIFVQFAGFVGLIGAGFVIKFTSLMTLITICALFCFIAFALIYFNLMAKSNENA